jgi:hypothetical protein
MICAFATNETIPALDLQADILPAAYCEAERAERWPSGIVEVRHLQNLRQENPARTTEALGEKAAVCKLRQPMVGVDNLIRTQPQPPCLRCCRLA